MNSGIGAMHLIQSVTYTASIPIQLFFFKQIVYSKNYLYLCIYKARISQRSSSRNKNFIKALYRAEAYYLLIDLGHFYYDISRPIKRPPLAACSIRNKRT